MGIQLTNTGRTTGERAGPPLRDPARFDVGPVTTTRTFHLRRAAAVAARLEPALPAGARLAVRADPPGLTVTADAEVCRVVERAVEILGR